jgi:hypothetical protein
MTWRAERIDIETWPAIYALLAPALDLSGEEVSDLIDLLISHGNQLWVHREGGDPTAAAVSELETVAGQPCLHIRLMGGKNVSSWIRDAVDAIGREARRVGAARVRVEVIPALERVLRERGFKRAKVAMDMPITAVPA